MRKLGGLCSKLGPACLVLLLLGVVAAALVSVVADRSYRRGYADAQQAAQAEQALAAQQIADLEEQLATARRLRDTYSAQLDTLSARLTKILDRYEARQRLASQRPPAYVPLGKAQAVQQILNAAAARSTATEAQALLASQLREAAASLKQKAAAEARPVAATKLPDPD